MASARTSCRSTPSTAPTARRRSSAKRPRSASPPATCWCCINLSQPDHRLCEAGFSRLLLLVADAVSQSREETFSTVTAIFRRRARQGGRIAASPAGHILQHRKDKSCDLGDWLRCR
ncbi:protein of unknown function [Aminobacter niigataensis]|nr:protein of unknown function [Aminobacter niigataensis]